MIFRISIAIGACQSVRLLSVSLSVGLSDSRHMRQRGRNEISAGIGATASCCAQHTTSSDSRDKSVVFRKRGMQRVFSYLYPTLAMHLYPSCLQEYSKSIKPSLNHAAPKQANVYVQHASSVDRFWSSTSRFLHS